MKKRYIKPAVEIERFVSEEIMSYNPQNILSYDQATGGYYKDLDNNYISFRTGDNNVLNGINYTDFAK